MPHQKPARNLGKTMTFETLNLLKPILQAVYDKGYTEPTPIQSKVIPAVLTGGDIMASAQTGTGKTAGFTLPILQQIANQEPAKNLQTKVLILTPTRELAAQVHQSVLDYGKHLKLRSAVVFGGVNITSQIRKLSRGVEILIATPGRLLDLYHQKAIRFDQVEILVLDEADRMLDMGFIRDIKRILALLPKKRQNLLFSATFSNEINQLAKGLLHNPTQISVARQNSTVTKIEQIVHEVEKSHKTELLIHLIRSQDWQQALVFSRTKHGANKIVKQLLASDIQAAALHGNKSQNQRTKALQDFKQGEIKILVATDIAARGIDIEKLPQIVNFDLPNVPEDYVHRIGRTGRAGATGHAISFVSKEEIKLLRDIERLIKEKIGIKKVEGFIPSLIKNVDKDECEARPFNRKSVAKPKSKTGASKSKKKSDYVKPFSRTDKSDNTKLTAKSGKGKSFSKTGTSKSTGKSNKKMRNKSRSYS